MSVNIKGQWMGVYYMYISIHRSEDLQFKLKSCPFMYICNFTVTIIYNVKSMFH